MRRRFGFYQPAARYRALVDRLVNHESRWLDVGGGKTIFPNHRALSCDLAERCELLVGVDPSENILQNDLVDEQAHMTIEQYQTDEVFDLATLRMVAEHISDPESVIESLNRLMRPGGCVVIYTPNKWSLMSMVASIIPDNLHASVVRIFSPRRQDEDVFPTCYKMNTKRTLRSLFENGGFDEAGFAYVDDCVATQRFRVTYFLELCLWRLFQLAGVRYPENNILGVYQKRDQQTSI